MKFRRLRHWQRGEDWCYDDNRWLKSRYTKGLRRRIDREHVEEGLEDLEDECVKCEEPPRNY